MSEATKSQIKRFEDAAREAGCSESEEAFDETLRKLGKHKPVKAEKEKPE